MDLISIIIPVYNTRDYLVKCIESLVSQTYHNLEIIIVDDGSDNDTATLCDRLADKDSRIKVYHKQNAGVSIARNYGLDRSDGKYIGFVDSDDWVDPAMYKSLYEKAKETDADIVYCDAQAVWDDGRIEEDTWKCYKHSTLIETNSLTPDALRLIAGSVWRGLFKKTVEVTIRFPEGLKFSEDRFYNLQWIARSKKIYYIKTPYYKRLMRKDSCVNRFHPDAIDTIRSASEMINSFVADHFAPQFLSVYEQQPLGLTLQCMYGVFNSKLSFREQYKEIHIIASCKYLQSIVQKYKPSDVRLRLMRYHLYIPLFLLLWLHFKIKKRI